jgi:hypothetical protein
VSIVTGTSDSGTTLSISPISTVTEDQIFQTAVTNGVAITDLDLTKIHDFEDISEHAAQGASGDDLPTLEDSIKHDLDNDPDATVSLSGIIVDKKDGGTGGGDNHPVIPGTTMSSTGAFTVGLDSSGLSFNGISSPFTTTNVIKTKTSSSVLVSGKMEPATGQTIERKFVLAIPSTTGQLTPGTFAGTAYYIEEAATNTATAHEDGGSSSGGNHSDDVENAWSAQPVNITVAAGTGSLFSVSIDSATFSPKTDASHDGSPQGTFTTGISASVSQ